MLTRDEAQKLAKKALSFSAFPECEIAIASSENAFIRFAVNGVTTSGYTMEQSMSIKSVRDGRAGSTTLNEFDEDSLRNAVKRTEQIAMISPTNPEREEPLAPQKYPTVENYVDATARARNDVMIPHIRAVIEAAKAKDLVAAGFFGREAQTAAIANKQSNFGYGRTTDASLTTTVRTPQGSSSGWASQPAVRIDEIDGAAVANTAIEKCLRWRNPKRLEPGKYTVVLEATAVSDLVQLLGLSLSARSAEEGRSFLSKKGGGTYLGERLFPEFITLRSDPFDRRFSALPWSVGRFGQFFGLSSNAGLPAAPVEWIEKGLVKNLYYDRYWARKAEKSANMFPEHLVLEGSDKSTTDLIASVDRGLLVTRFFYIRFVNPQTVQLTGLTRDGLFLIEGGKITSPVVNFRFNESPVRLLQNTVALGRAVRVRGGEGAGMIAPPLVARDFPFTSISDAV
jgi:predicted Zn-dependent protease